MLPGVALLVVLTATRLTPMYARPASVMDIARSTIRAAEERTVRGLAFLQLRLTAAIASLHRPRLTAHSGGTAPTTSPPDVLLAVTPGPSEESEISNDSNLGATLPRASASRLSEAILRHICQEEFLRHGLDSTDQRRAMTFCLNRLRNRP